MNKTKRYKENPFLGGSLPTKKKVFISRIGEETWLNQSTGERSGTHVVKYKKVDSSQFVKLFAQNVGLTFDLTSAGIKAFNVLAWAIQKKESMNTDNVILNAYTLDDWIAENKMVFSIGTFRRGITELEKAQIIAKTTRIGHYFINPHFIFNGDRVAFTTILERKNTEEIKGGLAKQNDPYTADLLPTDADN